MNEYPEHQKLKAISDKSQAVHEFLEWLSRECGVELCTRHAKTEELIPWMKRHDDVIADFFEIDLTKINEEKEAMLAQMRKDNTPS